MNFRNLSDKALADFGSNVASQLGGTSLKAIDAATRTALLGSIGTLPVDLGTLSAAADVAETTRKAATSTKNTSREALLALMARVRNTLLAGLAPKEQYDLCGFDFRTSVAGPYVAQDPTELSAFGFSNGVNSLKFKGNNRTNAVIYQIWRRQGDTGAWGLLATTKRQSFIDQPVTPGQLYEYKVRATAAKSISNFSNITVVYGVS